MRRGRIGGILSAAAFLGLLAVPLPGQQATPPTYEELLARLKQADPDLDFQALRMAYSESPAYAPNSGDRRALEERLAKKDFPAVIQAAEKQLEENYLNVWAHWALWQASTETGDQKRAEFHQYVLRGILRSIMNSGDGKSTATAFVVISTGETYFVLAVNGIRVGSQALVIKEGHSYDKMTGTNRETNEEVTLYFNIDRPFGHLQRQLEPPKPDPKPKPK